MPDDDWLIEPKMFIYTFACARCDRQIPVRALFHAHAIAGLRGSGWALATLPPVTDLIPLCPRHALQSVAPAQLDITLAPPNDPSNPCGPY